MCHIPLYYLLPLSLPELSPFVPPLPRALLLRILLLALGSHYRRQNLGVESHC